MMCSRALLVVCIEIIQSKDKRKRAWPFFSSFHSVMYSMG